MTCANCGGSLESTTVDITTMGSVEREQIGYLSCMGCGKIFNGPPEPPAALRAADQEDLDRLEQTLHRTLKRLG